MSKTLLEEASLTKAWRVSQRRSGFVSVEVKCDCCFHRITVWPAFFVLLSASSSASSPSARVTHSSYGVFKTSAKPQN